MKFKIQDLSAKDRYKFLTGSVVPRPIAWITTRNSDESINLAPFSYFSLVATEVPIVSVAINRNKGKLKDTSKNLLQTRECVIHIANHEFVEAMNASSMTLPYGESEVSKLNLETQSSVMIETPSLKDVKIKLETVLVIKKLKMRMEYVQICFYLKYFIWTLMIQFLSKRIVTSM
ncbi:flavin reductase family protein [Erysipelothrix rhusiopathiae]|uniref:flavin reductase family protein n=1 Tax=Erysipelothrix rhusiopathiae TaxID=1648 RepID=UPI000210B3D7|nr:flavin reductase family protein [Erysipelothrix rhusiopathiae]BAK31143.1 flavin reductase FMN-binding domain-containing protein [Erysipelothrix rhusiopathiae str. Fujisawa]